MGRARRSLGDPTVLSWALAWLVVLPVVVAGVLFMHGVDRSMREETHEKNAELERSWRAVEGRIAGVTTVAGAVLENGEQLMVSNADVRWEEAGVEQSAIVQLESGAEVVDGMALRLWVNGDEALLEEPEPHEDVYPLLTTMAALVGVMLSMLATMILQDELAAARERRMRTRARRRERRDSWI